MEVNGLSPNVVTWVDYLPVLVLPVFVVVAALLYGGVIPAGAGTGGVESRSRSHLRQTLGAMILVGLWTLAWSFVALVIAVHSEDVNSYGPLTEPPPNVREPFGLLFTVALLAWATPFAVSAYRRRGAPWLLLAGAAGLIASYVIVDLFANPLYCACN